MINFELVKHLVRTEFSSKRIFFWRSVVIDIFVFVVLFVFRNKIDIGVLPLVFMIFVFIPLIASMQSSIAPMPKSVAQGDDQSLTYSWKYLHSIISDRKSFVFGLVISKILIANPSMFLGIYVVHLFGVEYQKMPLIVISVYLAIVFLSSISIFSIIQLQRKQVFQYNRKRGLRSLILKFKSELVNLYRVATYPAAVALFVKFFFDFSFYYGILALIISLIVLNFSIYKFIFTVWTDERKLIEVPSLYSKKIVIRTVLVVLLVYANIHYHGFLFDNEDKFFSYIRNNKLEDLKKISLRENINQLRDSSGKMLIHSAVYYGRLDIVEYLIANGSHLESKIIGAEGRNAYTNGMTPLLFAIFEGQNTVAKYLIDKGANINAQNELDNSAFSIATFRCNPEMMKVLVEKGVNWNQISSDGVGPYFYAIKGRCLVAIEYLKKLGADESLRNKEGLTYLEYAKEHKISFYRELKFYQENISK